MLSLILQPPFQTVCLFIRTNETCPLDEQIRLKSVCENQYKLSSLINIKKILNRPITKFCNSIDVNFFLSET